MTRAERIERALRAWDSLLGMPRAKLFAELKEATRLALAPEPETRCACHDECHDCGGYNIRTVTEGCPAHGGGRDL